MRFARAQIYTSTLPPLYTQTNAQTQTLNLVPGMGLSYGPLWGQEHAGVVALNPGLRRSGALGLRPWRCPYGRRGRRG
jgi:hypothetical protein